MKKAILILMILSMLLALAACGSSGPVGTWHVKSVSYNGESITVEQSPELRNAMGDLVLDEGGTGSMTLMGTRYQINWDDKNISAEGESIPYSVSGNTLTLNVYGMIYTFTR